MGALTDALSLLQRETPSVLIGEASWSKLVRIAESAPSGWDSFGFEVRLGEGSDVDLGLAMKSLRGAITSRGASADRRVEGGKADPRLQRLGAFAQQWHAGSSILNKWVPFVFLEYDAASACDLVSVPSIFVALDAPLNGGSEGPLSAALEAARVLRGCPVASDLRSTLEACFTALGREGLVLHIGVMLGRDAKGLRLSVLLPRARVFSYLHGVGSLQAAECSVRVLSMFPGWPDKVQLDFDFDPQVRPRIGFGVRPSLARLEGWQGLVNDLTAAKCCRPDKGAAIIEWAQSPVSGMRRHLSHLKLACEGAVVTAKAYLGVRGPEATGVGPG